MQIRARLWCQYTLQLNACAWPGHQKHLWSSGNGHTKGDCIRYDTGPAVKMNILYSPSTRPLLRVLRALLLVDLLVFPPPPAITCTSDSSEDDLLDESDDSVSSVSPSSMKSRSEPSESDSIKRCNTTTETCKTEKNILLL